MKQRISTIADIVKDVGADRAWALANFTCKGKLEKNFLHFYSPEILNELDNSTENVLTVFVNYLM